MISKNQTETIAFNFDPKLGDIESVNFTISIFFSFFFLKKKMMTKLPKRGHEWNHQKQLS